MSEFLEKHCKTSKNGIIALSQTFVESAIKVKKCPIRVTCDDYPGQVSEYSVEDLLKPAFVSGPYPNKNGPGEDIYMLCMYPWKVQEVASATPVEEKATPSVIEVSEDSVIESRGGKYIVKTPVTVFEESEITLPQYIGHIVSTTREKRGLNISQLSNLTNGEVSATSIGAVEKATTNPTLSILESLADKLGLHISELFPPKN